jgi:hypothetical protein
VPAARVVLGAGLLAGLSLAWFQRHAVVDAYSLEADPAIDIRLSGVDLTVEASPVPRSPFLVDPGPDTRQQPITVTADHEQIEAPAELAFSAGSATLRGVVTGPDGPVPSAVVRLERHTTVGMTSDDVEADEGGQWSAPELLGGRYRVRAWLTGEYGTAGSEVLFLNEGQSLTLDLAVDPVEDRARLSLVDSGDIHVGFTGTVAVTVTRQSVDADGYVVMSGVPGAAVTLEPSAGVTVSPATASADPDGVARFVIRCEQAGAKFAVARHEAEATWYALPDCLPTPTEPDGGEPAGDPMPGLGLGIAAGGGSVAR